MPRLLLLRVQKLWFAARATWDPNGKLGWYIGPSPHHYRCVKCYIPTTRGEVNTGTVVFFSKANPVSQNNN